MYQYLVYIRPFADFLRAQLGLGHLRSTEFLFEDQGAQEHLANQRPSWIRTRKTGRLIEKA
jgi:hypothetical protein